MEWSLARLWRRLGTENRRWSGCGVIGGALGRGGPSEAIRESVGLPAWITLVLGSCGWIDGPNLILELFLNLGEDLAQLRELAEDPLKRPVRRRSFRLQSLR